MERDSELWYAFSLVVCTDCHCLFLCEQENKDCNAFMRLIETQKGETKK